MFEMGSGRPLVLVPGIQGRWEWMKPAVKALAERFRVITFSLAGEPGSLRRASEGVGLFEEQVAQVDAAASKLGTGSALVCGVSYGGLVALWYAATRPERAAGLVLASAPGPRWRPGGGVMRDVASPWLAAPGFLLGAPRRLLREISAARPGRRDRAATIASYLWAIATHPTSPARMAARVRALAGVDLVAAAKAVSVPTLIVTGDPDLDRVVPVAGTREYADLIRDARLCTIERTGHIGLVTRPDVFAAVIGEFADSSLVGRRLSVVTRGDA